MSVIRLVAPAGRRKVAYGEAMLGADPDGTLGVPRYAVAALIEAGCALVEGQEDPGPIDVAAELADCPAHELPLFLMARGEMIDMAAGFDALRARALVLSVDLPVSEFAAAVAVAVRREVAAIEAARVELAKADG